MSRTPQEPTPGELEALMRKSRWFAAKAAAARPKRIGDVLAQIQARHGFAQVQSAQQLAEAWREAVGPMLAAHTRVAALRRGVLEIIVESSAIVQEMTFQKETLTAKMADLAPESSVRQLRFRVGPLA
jgi:predicted nucleic acid-binding Zn ribbon protein